jgi:hypothetical protein
MGLFRKLSRAIRGPRHHLGTEEKAWVERRLLWLTDQFGAGPLVRAPLGPKSRVWPARWDASCESGAELLHNLCEFMRVDPARLELQYYSRSGTHEMGSDRAGERHYSGPAGLYIHPKSSDRLVIALEVGGLANLGTLAATICHELGHVHLLADHRIEHKEEDCEPLTDLLTVYFGAGILTANSAFQFQQWQTVSHQGWTSSRRGYLSEAVLGYALACYAWLRGESEPQWADLLRRNIRYYFEDALHYLQTTRDTIVPFGVASESKV